MERRKPTDEEKNKLFVIVDDENRDMFLKTNELGEMETDEGLEGSELYNSDEIKEFLADNPTGWHIMTLREAIEQENYDEFQLEFEE